MNVLRIVKHSGIVIASVMILLGIFLWGTGSLHSLFSDDPDAVTSASIVLDQPSGNYIILLNRALHTDEEKLKEWTTFFSGGEILYIFEDIACSVANVDAMGRELADSFRSRLPENQMQVKPEDITLLLSRADAGLYDVIILSREFADAYAASTAYTKDAVLIELMDIPGDGTHFHQSFARVF